MSTKAKGSPRSTDEGRRYFGSKVDKALTLAFASVRRPSREHAFLMDCEDYFIRHQHLPAIQFKTILEMCDPVQVSRMRDELAVEREADSGDILQQSPQKLNLLLQIFSDRVFDLLGPGGKVALVARKALQREPQDAELAPSPIVAKPDAAIMKAPLFPSDANDQRLSATIDGQIHLGCLEI